MTARQNILAADTSRTCEGCRHIFTEDWDKSGTAYRCGAPGNYKGRVVGIRCFDPWIPAWCPLLKGNEL